MEKNPQTLAQPVRWHGVFAKKSGAPFILKVISIPFYSSVTDFLMFQNCLFEVELIKTTLTTLIIFCYRSLTEIEVIKFKLNIFTLLKHFYLHLLSQRKEKLEYPCKIFWVW